MSTDLQQLQPSVHPDIHARFNDLSPRQTRFIDRYLVTSNATESAIYAGYQGTEQTIAATASRLLRNHKIRLEIQRRLGKSVASPSEVLETLTRHARADLTDVLTPEGEFDYKLARRKRILKKLKVKHRYEKDSEGNLQPVTEQEYEIHDPQSALEKLGRFHKLFDNQATPVQVNITVERTELTPILQHALGAALEVEANEPQSD